MIPAAALLRSLTGGRASLPAVPFHFPEVSVLLRIRTALALASIVLPTALAAQSPSPVAAAVPAPLVVPARQESPVARRSLIAINPIGAVLGYYAVNFERALDGTQSLGVSATLLERGFDDDDYDTESEPHPRTSLSAHYRYYPRAVFRGLSLDGQVGWAEMQSSRIACDISIECATVRDRASAIHFGFELGYNWALGSDNKLHVGVGLGARRHIVMGDEELDGDGAFATPTGRLSVGLRF